MYDCIEQECHRCLTSLHTLGDAQCFLYISADFGEAVLELLITIILQITTRIVAAVMLVATPRH